MGFIVFIFPSLTFKPQSLTVYARFGWRPSEKASTFPFSLAYHLKAQSDSSSLRTLCSGRRKDTKNETNQKWEWKKEDASACFIGPKRCFREASVESVNQHKLSLELRTFTLAVTLLNFSKVFLKHTSSSKGSASFTGSNLLMPFFTLSPIVWDKHRKWLMQVFF